MIRTLYRADIPRILAIEQAAHVAPWTEETFQTCFTSGYLGWIIEHEQEAVGFLIASFTLTECHILNLCVKHEYQHQGFGRQLLLHALNYAKQQGILIAYLEVRRSNSRAISLYEKMNFHVVGERKNYYPTVSGHEDALIFACHLASEEINET